jgi:hypothetical protein
MRGKVSACFFKNTNSEEYSESHIKLVFLLSLSLIGKFSPVYIPGRLSGSQVASGTTFIVTGGYRKVGKSLLGYWKGFHNYFQIS